MGLAAPGLVTPIFGRPKDMDNRLWRRKKGENRARSPYKKNFFFFFTKSKLWFFPLYVRSTSEAPVVGGRFIWCVGTGVSSTHAHLFQLREQQLRVFFSRAGEKRVRLGILIFQIRSLLLLKETEAGGPIPFGLLLSLTWMQGRLSTWFRRKKERKNKCTLYCYRAQRERSCGVYEEDAALPLAWGTRAHPERRPDDPPHSAHNAMPSCLPVRKKIARGFLFFLFFLSAKSSATTGTLGARQHGLSIVSWSSFYRLTAAIENLGNGIFTRDAGWFKCGSESHHLF